MMEQDRYAQLAFKLTELESCFQTLSEHLKTAKAVSDNAATLAISHHAMYVKFVLENESDL
jgi:hypothetical protein